MGFASTTQNFQDWFTQQWAIIWGKKINPIEYNWLLGPFGSVNSFGEDFILQLIEKEDLIIQKANLKKGLLASIQLLNLSNIDLAKLPKKVIDFYENTSNYSLNLNVKWNPFFRIFGVLVNTLFSKRINQLNIPTNNFSENESLTNEIIQLVDPKSNQTKYTIWLRKIEKSNKIIYLGIYSTCTLPDGNKCVKAVFPLPNGNATVILNPSVGINGELILDASGKKMGDAGFYFLLNDYKGNYWTQYIQSFQDKLIVNQTNDGQLVAKQALTLWKFNVLTFTYRINKIV